MHHLGPEHGLAAEQRDRARQRLAHADLGVVAGLAPERHERAGDLHLRFEVVVDRSGVGLGPVGQVHGAVGRREVAVQLVGEEGAVRRQDLRRAL